MENNFKIDIEYIKSTYDKNNTFHQSVLKFIDMIESCDKPDSDADKVRWQNLIEQIILLITIQKNMKKNIIYLNSIKLYSFMKSDILTTS